MPRKAHKSGAVAIAEFLLLIGCYLLPTYLWLGAGAVVYLFYEGGLNADVFTASVLIVVLYLQGLYGPRRRFGADLVLRLISAIGVGFLLEASVYYIQQTLVLPLTVMLAGSGLAFLVLLTNRFLYEIIAGREQILFIGATPVNREIAGHLQSHPELGLKVIGFLDDRLPRGSDLEGTKVLGAVSSLPEVRRLKRCRILADVGPEGLLLPLMSAGAGVASIESSDALYESLFEQVSLGPDNQAFDAELTPRRSRLVVQALYTNIVSLCALLVTAPVIVATALLIRIRCGSPVFETQTVAGWNLIPFTRLRFRCYHVVKTEADERRELTGVGRWLRKFHIDSLPQLVNVLRGEMALVGPLPLRTEYASTLVELLPPHRLLSLVRPGLVSWSGVNGVGTDVVMALEYDLHYIKWISPVRDFAILRQAFSRSASYRRPRDRTQL